MTLTSANQLIVCSSLTSSLPFDFYELGQMIYSITHHCKCTCHISHPPISPGLPCALGSSVTALGTVNSETTNDLIPTIPGPPDLSGTRKPRLKHWHLVGCPAAPWRPCWIRFERGSVRCWVPLPGRCRMVWTSGSMMTHLLHMPWVYPYIPVTVDDDG